MGRGGHQPQHCEMGWTTGTYSSSAPPREGRKASSSLPYEALPRLYGADVARRLVPTGGARLPTDEGRRPDTPITNAGSERLKSARWGRCPPDRAWRLVVHASARRSGTSLCQRKE